MKRGDVVLVLLPPAAGKSPKNRPALVVQADYVNKKINNVMLAAITSNMNRANDPAHYLIDMKTPEGQKSGLARDSLVSCLNLTVLPKTAIGPQIGELSEEAMRKVGECLKVALGLS